MTNLHVRVYYDPAAAPLYYFNVKDSEVRPQAGDLMRIDTESTTRASDAKIIHVAWRSDFKVLEVDVELMLLDAEAVAPLAAALKWTPITDGKDPGDSAVPKPFSAQAYGF
jgi:hypothetical protein